MLCVFEVQEMNTKSFTEILIEIVQFIFVMFFIMIVAGIFIMLLFKILPFIAHILGL